MMVICAGCNLPIYDRYLFNVLDKTWHATCIICSDCKSPLNETCFSRDGLLYCKNDFNRRFGTKCAGCDQWVSKTDLVRRARDKVFHVECFCCSVCQKRLDTGEELYILNGSKFICRQDYLCRSTSSGGLSECGSENEEEDELMGLDDSKSELEVAHLGSNSLTELGETSPGSAGKSDPGNTRADSSTPQKNSDENATNGSGGTGSKRRGPRTTIKAKQLETLKAAFAATPKPTRHIREQLAQETGLNMRVIQVWFQNRRSKERRMKQLRYGGYRPGRRSRGGISREESMAQHMFPEGMPRPGDPFYQHPMGYYCEMYGGPEPGHPDVNLAPQGHPAQFMIQPDDTVTPLEAHPPEAHFAMDQGPLRPPQASPDMPMGGEDAFRPQLSGFMPPPKSEPVMSVGSW